LPTLTYKYSITERGKARRERKGKKKKTFPFTGVLHRQCVIDDLAKLMKTQLKRKHMARSYTLSWNASSEGKLISLSYALRDRHVVEDQHFVPHTRMAVEDKEMAQELKEKEMEKEFLSFSLLCSCASPSGSAPIKCRNRTTGKRK